MSKAGFKPLNMLLYKKLGVEIVGELTKSCNGQKTISYSFHYTTTDPVPTCYATNWGKAIEGAGLDYTEIKKKPGPLKREKDSV